MMKMERILLLGLTACAVALSAACAHAPMPYQAPVKATPPSGNLAVSYAVNVLDASGSQEEAFASGKSTFESIVGVMPDGRYSAGNVVFGGYERNLTGQAPFDRSRLTSAANGASFIGEATPLFDVIDDDLQAALLGTEGKAAVVLVSDGNVTDFYGRGGADTRTLESAIALAAARTGQTCFHTIQNGSDANGAIFLEALSDVTPCGTFRNASSLQSASALQQFSREVYLGAAPKPQPRGERDSDRDGVFDSADACPNTLLGARVDSRGCWRLKGLEFATNKTVIESQYAASLAEDIAVLEANPGVRIRIDGHTDSDGSEAYNQSLSERRAQAVRDYFESVGGLDGKRFEVMGFGESMPAVPNDSSANKRHNRRVELTILP